MIAQSLVPSLMPAPLMGNAIGPSFVDFICAPLPAALISEFMAVAVALPILLAITTIESLVVNRLSKAKRFWQLFRWLFLANAISSLFGFVADIRSPGSIYPVWWGFVAAGVLSAIIEFPFLWRPLRRDGFRYRTVLKFSLAANAASYAFLAVVVLGFTAIPMYQTDPTNLRSELRGQIFVYHYHNSLTVLGGLPSIRPVNLVTDAQPYTHGFFGSPLGRMFLIDGQLRAWELKQEDKQWRVASQPTELPGRLLTVGADGETLVCGTMHSILLVNRHGTITKTIATDDRVPMRAALSYDSRYLAYTVMDLDDFNSHAIAAFGGTAKGTRGTMRPSFVQEYGTLRLLDCTTGRTSDLGQLHGGCMGFHPSMNRLAIAETIFDTTWIRTVRIVDVETLSSNVIWTREFGQFNSNIAWSPDGRFLACLQWRGPHGFVSRGYDASLWVITADGKRSAPLPAAFAQSKMGLWDVAWRND